MYEPITCTTPGHYRFVHDRIRETAYALLPPGKSRQEVHLKVGRQLRSWMDTSAELGFMSEGQCFSNEALLLHAAKQSNLGADLINDEWELLELAELNYQAAELAASKAAFYSAMEYLQVGLSHLGSGAWENHYDWALKFSNALTRMQYCCGLLDECWDTAAAVLRNGKSFTDKNRAYFTSILCLMQQDRNEEALVFILDALALQGRPLPRNNILRHALCEYFEVSRYLKSTTDDEFAAMPAVIQDDIETYGQFLEKLGEVAWLTANFGYLVMYMLRLLALLKEKGNCPLACHGIILWGHHQSLFGYFAEGSRYARIGTTLAEKQDSAQSHVIARFNVVKHCYVEIWQMLIQESMELVVDTFKRYWISGQVEAAIQGLPALFNHLFLSGEPLARVAKECDKYSEVFVDYNQIMQWYINASVYQAVLNLQGKSKNPAVLTGTHMDADACLAAWTKTRNEAAKFQFQFWSMYVAYQFGDYQLAKRNTKAMGNDLVEFGAGVLLPVRLLFTGIVYFGLFRQTWKLRYRHRAIAAYRKLKRWERKGVVACIYMCRLLEAEKLSSCRRQLSPVNIDNIRQAYDKAIQAAVASNQCQDQALACECCGAFLLVQADQRSAIARAYLAKAAELYRLWGAEAKVDELASRYGESIVAGKTYKAQLVRSLRDTEAETCPESSKSLSGSTFYASGVQRISSYSATN